MHFNTPESSLMPPPGQFLLSQVTVILTFISINQLYLYLNFSCKRNYHAFSFSFYFCFAPIIFFWDLPMLYISSLFPFPCCAVFCYIDVHQLVDPQAPTRAWLVLWFPSFNSFWINFFLSLHLYVSALGWKAECELLAVGTLCFVHCCILSV